MPRHFRKSKSAKLKKFDMNYGAGEGSDKRTPTEQIRPPPEVEKFLDKAIKRES